MFSYRIILPMMLAERLRFFALPFDLRADGKNGYRAIGHQSLRKDAFLQDVHFSMRQSTV